MSTAETMAVVRQDRIARRALKGGPEVLRLLQADRLNRVLEAAVRVEPYSRLYPGGTLPDLRGPEDLARLPLIDRTMLASLPLEARVAVRPASMVIESSSGTTGAVLLTARSEDEAALEDALFRRQERALGLDPRAPHLLL